MKAKLIAVAIIVLIAGGAYWYYRTHGMPAAPTQQASGTTYAKDGLIFAYPKTLYLKEHEANEAKLIRALVLVEDSESNRALLNGTAPVAGEGPPSITIEVYKNPNHLSPEEWMRQDTNWTQAAVTQSGLVIGGLPAVSFDWSGLYEGHSSIVSYGDRIYVFSYTWMSADDMVVKEVSDVFDSVKFK